MVAWIDAVEETAAGDLHQADFVVQAQHRQVGYDIRVGIAPAGSVTAQRQAAGSYQDELIVDGQTVDAAEVDETLVDPLFQ